MDIEKELRDIRRELERIAGLGRPLPGLVTKEQAAEFLSVSKDTINRMVERGDIRLAPLGKKRHPRIPMGELQKFTKPATPAKRGSPKRGSRGFDVHAELAKLEKPKRERRR